MESLHAIVDRLAEETEDPSLISSFSVLQLCRDYVEYDYMEDFQFKSARPGLVGISSTFCRNRSPQLTERTSAYQCGPNSIFRRRRTY